MTTSPPATTDPDAAAPPAGGARRSRRRLLWTLAAISVGWKLVVFTLGAAIPGWIIDDGIGSLPDDLRPYARDAQRTAATLWNGPIERHGVVRKLRVMSVQRVTENDAERRCGGLGARVRAYTYFGVPYSEARLVCDSGTVEYRVFRRRPTPVTATPATATPAVPRGGA